MYKIRYHGRGLNNWFQDWTTFSKKKAYAEFEHATKVLTNLDQIELWKFKWLDLQWILVSSVSR